MTRGSLLSRRAGRWTTSTATCQKLGAAFDTALIKTGSTANDVLRGTVETVTHLVSAFGELPGPVQGSVLAVAAAVAGFGLLAGGALKVIPMISNFRTSLDALGTSMRTVTLAGGAVGLAVTALVTVLGLVAGAQADAKQTASDLADTLDKETGAITKNTRAYAADKLQKDGTIKASAALGLSAKEVVDAYLQQPAALEKARKALSDMKDANSDLRKSISSGDDLSKMSDGALYLEKALGDGAGATKDAKERLQELRDATGDAAQATDDNADSTNAAATSYLDAASAASGLTDQVSQLIDEVNKANGVGQDAGLGEHRLPGRSGEGAGHHRQGEGRRVDGYSTSFDESTAAGADNVAMFSEQAAKSQAAAQAQLAVDGNTQGYLEHARGWAGRSSSTTSPR
jgi:hypothetical protein